MSIQVVMPLGVGDCLAVRDLLRADADAVAACEEAKEELVRRDAPLAA